MRARKVKSKSFDGTLYTEFNSKIFVAVAEVLIESEMTRPQK